MDEWIFQLSGYSERLYHSQQRPSFLRDSTEDVSADAAEESDSLLPSAEAPVVTAAAALPPQRQQPSWTLTSPFWSLSSHILLKVTYRPAWQAIPEYTNCTSKTCGAICARCKCCSPDNIDWYTATWTTKDIHQVEQVEAYHVKGVGVCKALKIHLNPLREQMPPVPQHLQAAWEMHVSRMAQNQTTQDEPNKGEETTDLKRPLIIVGLPELEEDAPLLYQVEFPAMKDAMAVECLTVMDGKLSCRQAPEPTHIYINGYQSWSFAGSIAKGSEQPTSALPDLFSGAFNRGGDLPPSPTVGTSQDEPVPLSFEHKYKSDFFACITSDTHVPRTRRERKSPVYSQLDETGGPAVVLGWLAQREQFGVVSVNRELKRYQMHASCNGQILIPGGCIRTDWMYAQLLSPHSYDEEPLAHYLHHVASFNSARPLQNGSLLTGWCSWYHYYENISGKSLSENFAKLAAMRQKVPTNVSVVDDGYMTAWGDWESLKPGKFDPEEGMKNVAQDIQSYGMRPGIWLAPFAADKHSKICRDHEDWIIHNDEGSIANSASCGKFFYGLDATNPSVRKHAHESIRRAVEDWGYNVLKLDFLYAACLHGNGRFDLSLSRAQAMHLALSTLRDAAGPSTFIIGCGCPIASAVGFVDGMRVSADTGPTWYPPLPLPWWDQGTLPCLRSMIRNSISRAPIGHRWWHNDPDCLLLGESTRLTDIEVASAASIVAMTCGMMLLSDDLTKVSMTRLRILTKIFPMTGVPGVVLDLHSTNDGLPSLLRLWCTDEFDVLESMRERLSTDELELDHNAEATFLGRMASFNLQNEKETPNERKRSCIHVSKGLGTWTIVGISNWQDKASVVNVPPFAMLPPNSDGKHDTFLTSKTNLGDRGVHGYHVFCFWSSKYSWISRPGMCGDDESHEHCMSKMLAVHETEIIHIKPVTPNVPQYIGSDLHFTCGREVDRFVVSKDSLQLTLKTTYNRVGHLFLFLPVTSTEHVKVSVNGKQGRWNLFGNTPTMSGNGSTALLGRVIRVMVVVHGDGSPNDGKVRVEF